MTTSPPPRLADLTTLRVGGPIGDLVEAGTEAEFIDAIRAADAAARPLLVLGGGSNLLPADAPFAGTVVRDMRQEITVHSDDASGGAAITVTAGTPWEQVVDAAVAGGWVGLEALTGIPGSTGATPVQNVGAYGQEVAEVISSVRCWDRGENRVRTFAVSELGFGYRTSILKRSIGQLGHTPRYVVLSVSFQMPLATLSAPIRYAELARALEVPLESRAPARQVREAVLALRRGKGMVLDDADHDTWSAGSFFTNPIVPESLVPAGAPAFPAIGPAAIGPAASGAAPGPPGGSDPGAQRWVKTSAAWLISRAGFEKGFTLGGQAALSTKHVLALTNRGGARAADLIALARHVRDEVARVYGITLVPEPVLVGVSL